MQVENIYNVGLWLVYIAPGQPFSTATIETLSNGEIKTIPKIVQGQNWWIMYEPSALKTAEINYNTWVSVEDISPSDKAALQAQEKADQNQIDAANKAEADRIAAEAKAE